MLFDTLLPFFGILIALIVVHELGHYITAKLTGVKVLEAGLGYPPRVWGFTYRGTIYSLNALPLGGFVRLLGEEDPSDPESLAAKSRPVRLLVLVAGSAMNFLLPILLFAIAFMIPRDVPVGPNQIVEVLPDSPAAQAGLRPGDVVLAVDGDDVRNSEELGRQIRLNMGSTIDMRILRPDNPEVPSVGQELTVPVQSRFNRDGPTGIRITMPYFERIESDSYLPWEAVPKGWTATVETLILAKNEVRSWFGGGGGPEFAGPVGIAQTTGEIVEQAGWRTLLEFTALLSINLAIINILPLPMLDGGRIAFVLLEIARRGKRIAPEKEALVHLIGLAAMITLAVVITYFDILRIFEGESLLR
ncbi:MAG TPA: M50 family metallopeptidase [Dehalococcoidia bacterium]|nr:M50 family metallopeptidase [Dehalococcoidia bacterium]